MPWFGASSLYQRLTNLPALRAVLVTAMHWGTAVFALTITAAIVVGCGARDSSDTSPLDRLLSQNVQAYKAAGLPYDSFDLGLPPAVSPADDAMPLLVKSVQLGNASKVKISKPLEQASAPMAIVALAKLNQTYKLLAQAGSKNGINIPAKGGSAEAGELITSAVRWLDLKAEALSLKGDFSQALSLLACAERILSFVEGTTDITLFYTTTRMSQELCRTLANCAMAARDNPKVLDDMSAIAQRLDRQPPLLELIRAQCYVGVDQIRKMDDTAFDRKLAPDAQNLRLGLASAQTRAFMSKYCATMAAVAPAFPEFETDPIAATHSWHDRVEKATPNVDSAVEVQGLPGAPGMNAFQSPNVIPNLPEYAAAYFGALATKRATLAMIAAIKYKKLHGAYPKTLEVMKGGDIKGDWGDPFTRGSLQFHQEGNLLRVYSLGPTGRDFDHVKYEVQKAPTNDHNYGVAAEPGKAL